MKNILVSQLIRPVAIISALVACGFFVAVKIHLALSKPPIVRAASTGPIMITPTTGGVFTVGNQGTITYCSGVFTVAGSGLSPTLSTPGKCVNITNLQLSPSETWTPASTGSVVFYLGNTTGHLIECMSENTVLEGIIISYGAAASCANYGNITP